MKDDLLLSAKKGNDLAFAELTKKYAPLIDSLARNYFRFCEGASESYEDFRQEATVAFYHALISFDCGQDKVSFGLYAKICIRNRLISVLRKIRSEKKHNTKAAETEKTAASVQMQCEPFDLKYLKAAEKLLTEYEKTVFYMYLDGKSYKDIALSLGRDIKSVDNALFRARSKLRSGCSM